MLIENDTNQDFDILNVSKIIKNCLLEEKFDIILSGLQSDDQGNGQLGVLLAEHLNMSHASLVMETNFNSDNIIECVHRIYISSCCFLCRILCLCTVFLYKIKS